MKKIGIILSLCICVGILTGCGKEKKTEKERTIQCTLSQNLSSYEIKSTYKAYIKGDIVESVDIIEVATSENEELLNALETAFNSQYQNLNDKYKGYIYKVTKGDKKVENHATIDYSKVDIKKFVADNEDIAKYVNSENRLTADGIIAFYQGNNAVCEK